MISRARRGWRRFGARSRRAEVLFVSGPGGEARRYRCDHQAEQLALGGGSAAVVYRDETAVDRLAGRHGCVVLYRVPWDSAVASLLDAARARGTTVLADVDDLVFDPERTHLIRALEQMSEPERRAYSKSIEGLRRTLAEVDGVVVSTEPLRAAAASVNARVAVAFNTVSAEMVERGENARDERRDASAVRSPT